ncbi:MAG: hypothetical protein IIC80_09650 [Chloroflexi bacterium]|nr:hypothetical protein [Chloroflexota bacterium]
MTRQARQDLDEAYVGKDLGRRDFEVTQDLLNGYCLGLDLDRSWYEQHSPLGGPVAPSMVVTRADELFSGAGFKNSFGTLWMRQEWSILGGLVPGNVYPVTSRIVDVYEHRNRTVAVQEVTVKSPEGQTMAQGRHHQSYLLDQSSGRVKLRDPKSKEGVRRFQVPAGEALTPVTRTISLEMCGRFFHGNANYHTERDAAERLGFDDVVVGGRMTLAYLGELLDKRFGSGWFQGGRLNVKFTNIVWPGDRVTARGVITGRRKENGSTRADVAVWMEKEDGTVVIVGAASALE